MNKKISTDGCVHSCIMGYNSRSSNQDTKKYCVKWIKILRNIKKLTLLLLVDESVKELDVIEDEM